MIEKKLKEAIQKMRRDLIEKRSLSYEEGSVGITSLIYCPKKVELKRKYPDLRSESNAIDDGYMFENTFEPYLEKVFDGRVEKDADIPFEIDGFKITGHPDFVIDAGDRIIILEFKAPIFFFVNEDLEIPDDGFVVDRNKKVNISESYILQTKIQKFITEKYYKKPVEAYLFLKTILQDATRRMQKVYVLRPVDEEITEEELKELVRKFKEDKSPRYHWECYYCIYAKEEKCTYGMLKLRC